jgi:hypothetical protein
MWHVTRCPAESDRARDSTRSRPDSGPAEVPAANTPARVRRLLTVPVRGCFSPAAGACPRIGRGVEAVAR